MRLPRAGGWLLPSLLALCLIRLWLMPLPSSFWLDETATVFVAQHGAHHPSLADAAPEAWRSWYYPIVGLIGSLFGFSEIALRLLSVLAMAGMLILVARLSTRLIHPQSGWFAVFACLALPGLNYQAANARPYALGMCVFAAGLLLLTRWLDSGERLAALGFAVCAALVLYIHLLFWPSWLVFAVYAAARVARGKTPVTWRHAALVFGLLACALLPVLAETLSLLRDARAHVIAPLPSPMQFVRSLELPLLAACAVGAWLLGRVHRGRPDGAAPSAPALVLIGAWWLCQPVLLYAFSWVTGDAVFVPRYLQLALPGAAMAATAAAAPLLPSKQWRPAATLLAIGVLLWVAPWRELWPRHHNSDWRAAALAVNRLETAGAIPVLCPSPFIEARPPAWRPNYPLPGFLYAHLGVYPVQGPTYLFPFANSPEADTWAMSLVRGPLSQPRRFVIYGWEPQVHFWRDWFARRPEFAGWRQRRLGPFADVDAVVFEIPE
ncbi:MAG: glycosyltransferase family 39 protein [Acidobacteriia bacterium]|nr:glycosyltransferase family 39 protein [Terriglobia bacterium]